MNIQAFLDMLALSEGTKGKGDDGYDVVVGGKLLKDYGKDYSDHPRILVQLRPGLASTAAGRYQFIASTWDELRAKLDLPDFGKASQDAAAIEKLRERGAYDHILAGRFDDAVFAARREWASLPGAGYGQHENKLSDLRLAYEAYGGVCDS